MFFLKRRRLKKLQLDMLLLVDGAMMVLYTKAQAEWTGGRGDENVKPLAGALTNYMIGKPFQTAHEEVTTPQELEAMTEEILDGDPLIRELVVQSRRIRYLAEDGGAHHRDTLSDPLLLKYGSQVPEAPGPGLFEALIVQTFETLPPGKRKPLSSLMTKWGVSLDGE